MRQHIDSFKKRYYKIKSLNRATCTLNAEGVGIEEIAWIDGKAARVIALNGREVTLQVFDSTEGLSTESEVIFTGKTATLALGDGLAGRILNAYGEPIDGAIPVPHEAKELNYLTVNPVRRARPSEMIETLLPGIDLNNSLVTGQKIPFFADPGQPYHEVLGSIAAQTAADRVVLGAMGIPHDDLLMFRSIFESAGMLHKLTAFVNTTADATLERLLVPDMALSTAEYFAIQHREQVLVLLTDMTLYADTLAIVANKMDQIPSKDSMPGSLYSDLARIYERAVQFQEGGSVTIMAVTTLSQGDITHAIPDNTGYITEGQLYLKMDNQVRRIIIDPFRSLSRLKQLVIGKRTREDHSQVMNAAIRLFADASAALTKQDQGFELSQYDVRAIAFASEYSRYLLAIEVRMPVLQALDALWKLLAKHFSPEETGIKKTLVDHYWPASNG